MKETPPQLPPSSSEATPKPGNKVVGVEGRNKSKFLGRVTIHSDVEDFDSGTESEKEKWRLD